MHYTDARSTAPGGELISLFEKEQGILYEEKKYDNGSTGQETRYREIKTKRIFG